MSVPEPRGPCSAGLGPRGAQVAPLRVHCAPDFRQSAEIFDLYVWMFTFNVFGFIIIVSSVYVQTVDAVVECI